MNQKTDPFDVHAPDRRRAQEAKQARQDRDLEEDDIRWLLSSRKGRRIVWRLLDQAGVFRSTFNTNSMQMAFAEGNRNLGLRLLAIVQSVAPELFPTMTKENTHEHRSNDAGNHNDH